MGTSFALSWARVLAFLGWFFWGRSKLSPATPAAGEEHFNELRALRKAQNIPETRLIPAPDRALDLRLCPAGVTPPLEAPIPVFVGSGDFFSCAELIRRGFTAADPRAPAKPRQQLVHTLTRLCLISGLRLAPSEAGDGSRLATEIFPGSLRCKGWQGSGQVKSGLGSDFWCSALLRSPKLCAKAPAKRRQQLVRT